MAQKSKLYAYCQLFWVSMHAFYQTDKFVTDLWYCSQDTETSLHTPQATSSTCITIESKTISIAWNEHLGIFINIKRARAICFNRLP